ncbi:integrase catalytic domain-containing protein [Trichonephila clavata]|uniref:Integrase catalytic domain-containing protein n=1 Tax=Trichonephila clavata TaxID=2740835 RepID=A0A8X6G2H1_TRICU|nr:integrase catalytic domain-containing protein [Trichonephila clavata]
MRKIWEIDNLGITNNIERESSEEEILKQFEQNINFKNGRYEVKLPFKDKVNITSNFNLVKNRLKGLASRFREDNSLYENYTSVLDSQLTDGIIESARPNLNPNLLILLLKFREFRIGLVSDVEKAFLQIVLAEEDRNCQRFLWAFRRFISNSRRGLCTVIYSDNARAFKRAEIELRQLWTIINHPDIKEFCSSRGVKWKYIIEGGAWWGGFYVRIVRSVKTILRKVIGKSSLTSEELETVLCEIEAVLNSRPITYIDSDSTGNFPLTPSHFLLGRRLTSLLAVKLSTIDCVVDKRMLIKRFNYRERLLNNFWKQWRKDYLLNLKSVHFVNPTK